ncbi:4'-phosphopantetheinyl transferase family protein [Halobacteriovorax sp. CON-3]|uniref:4'-phosphopantetheinyl transferase family protein n=1 Tax=Halobacteriovorax sp. CON-3 TaxID=3157710 RepID=UPI00371859DC
MAKEMLMSNKKFMRSTFLYLGQSELPEGFMADKRNDFRLSRFCLSSLTGLKDLSIINHLHLESDKSKLVSISHTKELAACALCTNPEVKSVGIDIEWSERKMREGTFKYFVSHERELKLHTPLEIWCIKEAAFKAYSPFHDDEKEKILVLTDFEIIEQGILQGPNDSELIYEIIEEEYQGRPFKLALTEY